MNSPAAASIQSELLQLLRGDLSANILAETEPAKLRAIAERLAASDFQLCASAARLSLAMIVPEPTEEQVVSSIEHLLFCTWRDARSAIRAETPLGALGGTEHLESTRGHPTVIVTPMMASAVDTLPTLAAIADREVAIYGEALPPHLMSILAGRPNFRVLDNSPHAARDILGILRRGGILCTYPDFVYSGHATMEACMFGQPRLFSRAFVRLCAREDTHLLPAIASYTDGQLSLSFEEPVTVETPGIAAASETRAAIVLQTIVYLLEDLIRRCPEHWLLLNTLVAECVRTV